MMKVRALVVEDSATIRILIMKLLRHSGLADFEFVEAEDGADGLAKFDSNDIDVIFLDWNMPRMNGLHFACEVRARPGTAHIPIVMITSERALGKVMDAMDTAGVDAYVCKPFTSDELQQKLQPVFEQLSKKTRRGGGLLGRILGKQ